MRCEPLIAAFVGALLAGSAAADQMDEDAARIAELSRNADLFTPQSPPSPMDGLYYSTRELRVEDCIVSYVSGEQVQPTPPPRITAQFDLSHATLRPDYRDSSVVWGYAYNLGVIIFDIDPAHPGTMQTRKTNPQTTRQYLQSLYDAPMIESEIAEFQFIFNDIDGPEPVAALADALLAYQANHCLLTG